jgi:ABC-type glycerol-3-phosphate transport system substrate-binding protein
MQKKHRYWEDKMTGRREQEYLLQEAARRELELGRIDRREFLTRSLVTGLGLAGVGAVAKYGIEPAFAADRPLTPTFYQWIQDLHPGITAVNAKFPGINYQIAPVEGFGIERFVAEAKNKESTWDVYVGQTPFVEMSAFVKADVIEPWDNYIPKEVIDDIIPSIREECTIDGKLYSWPFLLDVVGSAWHSGLTTKAGLPDAAPATWDDFLAGAKKIVDTKAAPWGATFDSHGWRSLVPITHSMSTKVYTPDGLFDFTSEPAVEALKLMKKMMAYANPDILLEGASDAGVNGTPDEVAFAAQRVGLYFKYFNAPLRMAASWDDPKLLHLGPLPKFANGEGSTVFWTTGCALMKYGQNKEKAAAYIKALTYDRQIWKDSIVGTKSGHPGQLPPYKSIYADWAANKPDWMPPFVGLVREQLDKAKAITNNLFGLQQFVIGKPIWETYLKGEEADPKVAMQKVAEAVKAAVKKAG